MALHHMVPPGDFPSTTVGNYSAMRKGASDFVHTVKELFCSRVVTL